MSRVLEIILVNALKFQKKGRPPEIRIKIESDHSETSFVICDNGIGIDPNYHEKVFHFFTRLHPRNKYTGSGVGLALAKKIVERMRGSIWIESEVDQGCCVCFNIPRNL